MPGQPSAWAPTIPAKDDFDWIQLESGEWLKGRLKAMQDDTLEFDSEELDELSFDFEDITQVRSPNTYDLLFLNKDKASGAFSIAGESVTVTGATTRTFPRAQLQSITRGGSQEKNYWSGNLMLGLTARAGNTRELQYNAQAALRRRTPGTRLELDYLGNISSSSGVESSANHRLSSEFDLWLSNRLYLVVPYAEYFADKFQNIADRITLGAGLGYDLVDRKAVEWNLTALPSLQRTRFDSVQVGEDETSAQGALVLGSDFIWEASRRVDLELKYQGQFTNSDLGSTLHHAESLLKIDLTQRFELDISLIWDRVDDPQTDADGITPEKDDFRMVVGFSVDF
ncbi:MAG: DUF481 domain-containing protein [Planctomycetes bacterium]|nr:DUF481 domain-containing protein [Planctomycetota bacterium]